MVTSCQALTKNNRFVYCFCTCKNNRYAVMIIYVSSIFCLLICLLMVSPADCASQGFNSFLETQNVIFTNKSARLMETCLSYSNFNYFVFGSIVAELKQTNFSQFISPLALQKSFENSRVNLFII